MLSGCNGFFSCCFEALLNTVYVGAICSTGFALGFVVTALFVYDKNDSILDKDKSDSSSEEEEEEEESELNQFCKKYWDEYNELTNRDLDEETIDQLTKSTIVDNLPFYGGVHMVYNKDFEGFHYYNDRQSGANISYKMLATVARKYVTSFDCKKLYVNLNEELEKSKKVLAEIERKIEEPTEKEVKEDVFANLKKNKDNRISQTKKDEFLIKGNFIKFKYMGKIEEMETFKQNVPEADDNTSKSMINFEIFKNMLLSQKNTEKDKDA